MNSRLLLLLACAAPAALVAAVTLPYAFTDGEVASAAQVNANFDTLRDAVNAQAMLSTSTPPDCDAGTFGRFYADPTNGRVHACNGSAWVPLSAADTAPVWQTAPGSVGSLNYHLDASVQLLAAGAVSYSVTAGALPAGLVLDGATGLISGNPADVATTTGFTVTATSDTGRTASRAFSLTTRDWVTSVHGYTGTDASITLPAGASVLRARVWAGAGGGGGAVAGNAHAYGGASGFTKADHAVSGGDVIVIRVGSGGGPDGYGNGFGGNSGAIARTGGDGALNPANNAPGGGGYSAILRDGVILQITGAGGGAPHNTPGAHGGNGGGSTGNNGQSGPFNFGYGGTPTAGGARGGSNGSDGSFLKGGNNGDVHGPGGGGAGYYGGGAGGISANGNGRGGGGGGSSYVIGTATNVTNVASPEGTHTPPGTAETGYTGEAGRAYVDVKGNDGLVVLQY